MSAIRPDLADSRVVDLFAGTGALGIEALSEGARHATFVENAGSAIRVLRENVSSLAIEPDRYRIIRGDVHRVVAEFETLEYGIALADPPYATDDAERLVTAFHASPFARILCVEHDPRTSFPHDAIWNRRYGDTALTFFSAPDV